MYEKLHENSHVIYKSFEYFYDIHLIVCDMSWEEDRSKTILESTKKSNHLKYEGNRFNIEEYPLRDIHGSIPFISFTWTETFTDIL